MSNKTFQSVILFVCCVIIILGLKFFDGWDVEGYRYYYHEKTYSPIQHEAVRRAKSGRQRERKVNKEK